MLSNQWYGLNTYSHHHFKEDANKVFDSSRFPHQHLAG